jgi:hypothetical protein
MIRRAFLRPDDPAIHTVFLAVQTVLFMPGNMTTMPVSHSSLFLADAMITTMHMISLAFTDVTTPLFSIDPMMLVL